MFQTWLRHWALIPDGNPVLTRTSALLPVTTIKEGWKAMLKLTDDENERTGGELMVWWNGSGAAQVMAHDLGERGFDYANIFSNPDLADPRVAIATDPNIFKQRVQLVSEIAGIERQRLLMWIAAWCGLSSAWFLEDGENAAITLCVAELAIAELDEESRQL